MATIDGALGLLWVGNREKKMTWMEGTYGGREGGREKVRHSTYLGELTHKTIPTSKSPVFHSSQQLIIWSPPAVIRSFNKYSFIQK